MFRIKVVSLAALLSVAIPVVADAQAPGFVPPGTKITVALVDELSSATALIGEPVKLQVAEDVTVEEGVIRKGTPVLGFVTAAQKAGRFGKKGDVRFEIRSLQLGRTSVPLSVVSSDRSGQPSAVRREVGQAAGELGGQIVGGMASEAPLAVGAVVGGAALVTGFKKNSDKVIPAGTTYISYTRDGAELPQLVASR